MYVYKALMSSTVWHVLSIKLILIVWLWMNERMNECMRWRWTNGVTPVERIEIKMFENKDHMATGCLWPYIFFYV